MIKKLFLLFSFTTFILFAHNSATYIGDKTCITCHDTEVKEWKNSHHDMAMMIANKDSIKADFNNTTFTYNGITTTFYKKDKKFMVQTDGPDGKLHDYEIAYTFGIYPLQQYMIKFPDGKIQVLDPTWDNRSKKEGGQRWYHIHQDENVTANDVLHWTGPNMNWNYMCADCHSTNLKKNYNIEKKVYHTTWDVINVSCEACHGPASKHLTWSKTKDKNISNKGFSHTFYTTKKPWRELNATVKSLKQKQELNVCAKCHSRRTPLDDNFVAGDNFYEHYLPVDLDEGLYFSDGKINDEVYVYNSFLQSRMYEEGVTCSDCHNPHSLKRKEVGDKVCFSCHKSDTYTATSHHKHKKGSTGASCISCHMPARTYMGVDSRNDHSFRIPRPDISIESPEIPNACNNCHKDKNASWATNSMKKWYGKIPQGKQKFSHSLNSLRKNLEGAPKELYNILTSDAPNIAKSTAVAYLGNYPSKQTYITTLQMLSNKDVMIRKSALQALEAFPWKVRFKKTFKSLSDPMKIVRIEAARQLSSLPMDQLNQEGKTILLKALDEYEKVLLFTAERPESQLSLALLYTNRGMPQKAKKAYEESLRLQKQFVPAYINYSNFLLKQKKSKEALKILDKGIQNVPDVAILHHAKGLWYVQNNEKDHAKIPLKKAVTLDPNNSRFSYVYAVLVGEKNPKEAISILEKVYPKHTGDIQIVSGLVYYYKQIGDSSKSEVYEKKLKALQNFSVK